MRKKKPRRKPRSRPSVHLPDPQIQLLLLRALALKSEIVAARRLYEVYDETIAELAAAGFQSAQVNGIPVLLVDNFAYKNVVWRATPVRRFDLQIGMPRILPDEDEELSRSSLQNPKPYRAKP